MAADQNRHKPKTRTICVAIHTDRVCSWFRQSRLLYDVLLPRPVRTKFRDTQREHWVISDPAQALGIARAERRHTGPRRWAEVPNDGPADGLASAGIRSAESEP